MSSGIIDGASPPRTTDPEPGHTPSRRPEAVGAGPDDTAGVTPLPGAAAIAEELSRLW